MKIKALVLTACLACGISTDASAAVFLDGAAFSAAVKTPTKADFNSLPSGFYGGPGNGGGFLTVNGFSISTFTSNLYSQAINQYGTGSFISAQQFSPTVVNMAFSAATAFGFNYVAGTPLTLTANGQSYAINASPFPTLSFFGITSDTPFSSITLSTNGFGVDLDNLTRGTANFASAVPEPSTWAMFFIGLGGIGAAMRRAKRRVTAARAVIV